MDQYSEIQKQIDEKRAGGAFVFMPSPILSIENSFYMPVMSEGITLREDEVYKATGKWRAHYNGLLRFSQAAGFEWSAVDTTRTDDSRNKMYCSFRAVGGVRKADGRIYFEKGEKDIDLDLEQEIFEEKYPKTWNKIGNAKGDQWKKDGHTSIETFVPAMVRRDLLQARRNKMMFVESGAKARVIRFVLGLQKEYSDKKQLQREHYFIHYALNPSHPDVRRTLLGSLAAAQNMIYGGVKDVGQIENTESDFNNDDVIDLSVDDQPEQTKPAEQGFKPAEKEPFYGDGNLVDFENSEIDEQVKCLQYLCKACNQDYDHYDKQSEGGIKTTTQKWRNDFFNYLVKEKGKK